MHYYFSNHLGSANVITSALGVVQEQMDFYPFGGVAYVSGSDPNHYEFTGKERDSESGLDNFGARYFTSSMGRFMTPDWAARPTNVPYAAFGDPQSLNLYTYVRNDPVTRADADGHCFWCHFGGTDEPESWAQRWTKWFWGGGSSSLPWVAQNRRASHHHHPHHPPKTQKQVAGTIYNETSTLRPTAQSGNGSAANLHSGRVGIAQVIEVNHSKEEFAVSGVKDNLKDPDAAAAWKDSSAAAAEATTAPNGTNGATHIYLDAGQPTKPNWYNQGEIEESFGPFRVNSDTIEFKAGEEVDIEIIVSPAPK